MSQLSSRYPKSQGLPPSDLNLWPEFVVAVLEVTLLGYLKLRGDFRIDATLEEDQITVNLEDCIEPIARKHPLKLQVQSQVYVYSQPMKDGLVTAKKAKRIDLKLWNPLQNHRRVYFAWEAKKLGGVKAYVTDGMMRFATGAYSTGLHNAGMLGYCMSQSIDQVAQKIDKHIQNELTNATQLKLMNLVKDQLSIHQSRLTRSDSSSIALHHFLLTF